MLRKNIFANYIGAGALVVVPVIALPFYTSLLGPKQFGLISFVATLQAFLGLIESGICQVSLREFSVQMNATDEGRRRAANLLFGFERIYWGLAIGIGLTTLLLGDTISNHWLVLDPESMALGSKAVFWGAVIFIVQFPGTLYRSFLAAAQAQVALNVVLVGGVIARHVGGIVALLIWPTLLTYLIWQATVALVETFVRSLIAWRTVQTRRSETTWNTQILNPVLTAIAKMSGVVLLGTLTTQLDKIILSRMVPIEQFGYYAIASTVALGVLNMIYPLVQAISPRIMQAVDSPREMLALNIRLTKMIAAVVACGIAGFWLGGKWVLKLWLRNPQTAATVYPLLAILFVGSVFNAFYHVGYFNWLAYRKTSRILLVNGISIVLCLSLTPMLINRLGMTGATLGFVAMNAIGLIISLEWITLGKAGGDIRVLE